jgi:hypothetical protein
MLLLSPNPIMTIALGCEILDKIAARKRKFYNECQKIKTDLLDLGKIYSSKIEDEERYENLILDEDFNQRTTLKIITDNNFEPLMDDGDPKAETLMMNIYNGKETTKCDGNIGGYSSMLHVILSKAKAQQSEKFYLKKYLTNNFEPDYKVDYFY